MSHSTLFSSNLNKMQNDYDDEKVNDVLEGNTKSYKNSKNGYNRHNDVDDHSFQQSQSLTDDYIKRNENNKENKKIQRKKYVKSKSKHSSHVSRISSASSAATEFDSAKTEELSDIFNQYCIDPIRKLLRSEFII
jgi:hypothetical protein